jgi:hypothetical protein
MRKEKISFFFMNSDEEAEEKFIQNSYCRGKKWEAIRRHEMGDGNVLDKIVVKRIFGSP